MKVCSAVWTGDLEEVAALLNKDPHLIDVKDELGCPPLYLAVYQRNVEMVKLLLNKGANPNEKTELLRSQDWGNITGGDCATPLHLAVTRWGLEGPRNEIVDLLIQSGADVNATDFDGMTPLEWALADDKDEIACLLLRLGGTIGKGHPLRLKRTATLRAHWSIRHFPRTYVRRLSRIQLLAHIAHQRKRERRNKHVRALRLKAAGGSFTKTEFKELCNQYGNVCLCCRRKGQLMADHVVPVSDGGKNIIDNIQPLCASCNSKKNNMTVDFRSDTRKAKRIRVMLLGASRAFPKHPPALRKGVKNGSVRLSLA